MGRRALLMTRYRVDHETPSTADWLREEARNLAEIAGLVGFAVVQPVLGPFGESPETFTAADASPGDIVRFALIVAVVPILLVWGLAGLARAFGEQARSIAQTVACALLGGLALSAIARSVGAGTVLRTIAALAGAGAIGYLHRHLPAMRLFLRYTAPVPVLLVAMFLFASEVAPLVRPGSAPTPTASTVDDADRPDVVMVVLDELPTLSIVDGGGAVDRELLPNLARLADTSTWYRNHTAVAPATGMSVPSLLTGQLPSDPSSIAAATADQFPDNLLTLLAESYETHGREWATDMCGRACAGGADELDDDALRLLARDLSSGAPPLTQLADQARSLWWSQTFPLAEDYDAGFVLGAASNADDLSRPSLEFLSGISEPSGDRPMLDYLHSALPHAPWWLLPDGRSYDAPEVAFGGEFLRSWPDDDNGADSAAAAEVRHRLQLQWADRILGAVIDRLQRLGRWDDALVVVTADHGISFEPGTSTRDATVDNQIPIAWTPLFVKYPGQTDGGIDDRPATALDVTPTVLDVVGIEAPWDIDGRTLAGDAEPDDGPRPFVVPEADRGFPTEVRRGIVALEADGLAAITQGDRPTSTPGDPLAAWRHGRHGDLLGRTTAELGVCSDPGPAASREVPDRWSALVAGELSPGDPLPLWHAGTLEGDQIDLAVVVDGVLAGWGRTLPTDDGQRFGVLAADPLVRRPAGLPELFQIVDGPCRLRAVSG